MIPLSDIDAKDPVDRYAAVKSLPFLPEKKKQAVAAIERRLDVEKEERVLLETAGAGTTLDSGKAWERLEGFVWDQERADLRREAVFILTELRSPGARDVLLKIVTINSSPKMNFGKRRSGGWARRGSSAMPTFFLS
jgi:hypothetical protein